MIAADTPLLASILDRTHVAEPVQRPDSLQWAGKDAGSNPAVRSQAHEAMVRSLQDKPQPLALVCAQRLNAFVRTHFDPHCADSWSTADKLWRAALLTRDVDRGAP